MALKVDSSFAAGELDPALRERTTLEKYKSGLDTARNVIIGKTGRLVSRAGRRHFKKCKYSDAPVRVFGLSHVASFIEYSLRYLRVYRNDGTLVGEWNYAGAAITEDDLENMHFTVVTAELVLVTIKGQRPFLIRVTSATPYLAYAGFFRVPPAPTFVSNTVGGTGFDVDYLITSVVDGVESVPVTTATGKLPITSSTLNTIVVKVVASTLWVPPRTTGSGIAERVSEIRVYRRPRSGGAYGFIGASNSSSVSGSDLNFTFVDVGQDADYTHTPPTLSPGIKDLFGLNVGVEALAPALLEPKTAVLYQQRLILSNGDKLEASRVGFVENFFRDYPYDDASALSLRNGSHGYAEVLRMLDNDGLVVFTSQGIYLSSGPLGISNLGFDKKGKWVIDDRVPPIAIPGGVLFVDSLTNTVRELSYSFENGSYTGEELSIFSDHLFATNRITSWAFQDGPFPLLWVTFVDGTYASFTFEKEHQMKAWTRHDSGTGVEFVTSTSAGTNQTDGSKALGEIIFVVNKDGQRHIEFGIPRYVSADIAAADSESDKNQSIMAADGIVSWSRLINDELTDDDMILTPVTPGDWSGPLTLSITDDAIFTSTDLGALNTIFRWFNPEDRTQIDLEVTARASNNSVTVSPSETFPEEYATNPRLYLTKNVFELDVTMGTLFSTILVNDPWTLTPVTPGVWDGPITLAVVNDNPWSADIEDLYGTEYYYHDTTNKQIITLTIISKNNANSVVVMPSTTYPSSADSSPVLYLNYTENYSLWHLEDEEVSIISDGFVLASPYNSIEDYESITVTGGSVTLPGSARGAIVHIGRPYVMDVATLNIETVEQRPTLIESLTVNKVYVRTHNTRGLYIGHTFPADDTLEGDDITGTEMVQVEALDAYDANYEEENPITGNRYDQPKSKRMEIILPGDWKSQGRICLRQVDPLHFEILSIIPDLDDQRR